jgi:hypothetical protein
MKRKRKLVKYEEVKRRKIFTEQKLNTIKDKLDTNEVANILNDMKNMPYHIIRKSPRIKYIETILSQDK